MNDGSRNRRKTKPSTRKSKRESTKPPTKKNSKKEEAEFRAAVEEEIRQKKQAEKDAEEAEKASALKRKQRHARMLALREKKRAEKRAHMENTPQPSAGETPIMDQTPAEMMNETPNMDESPQPTKAAVVEDGGSQKADDVEKNEEPVAAKADAGSDSDGDDMFEADDFEIKAVQQITKRTRTDTNRFLNSEVQDSEGYYIPRMGDVLNKRYTVFKNQGRGVFSTVLRVRDSEANNGEKVVKVIRNNEVMYKAGLKEIQHLDLLQKMDPDNKMFCVIYYEHFEERNHLCMVFEAMKCNLRQLMKKVGAGRGFSLQAVQSFSGQLFKALTHLKRCNMIHCDLKPDNILVSDDNREVKIADFGSALKPDEVEVTDVVGSRFYRAPEVMIGLKFNIPIDMWSMACVLAETYTGKILFEGKDNNYMLLKHQEICGRFPTKIGRNGHFWTRHFDSQGNFTENKTDIVTEFKTKIPHHYTTESPKVDLKSILDPRDQFERSFTDQEKKTFSQFKDLLLKMMHLDPSKRLTPENALEHPFLKKRKKKKKHKSARATVAKADLHFK